MTMWVGRGDIGEDGQFVCDFSYRPMLCIILIKSNFDSVEYRMIFVSNHERTVHLLISSNLEILSLLCLSFDA